MHIHTHTHLLYNLSYHYHVFIALCSYYILFNVVFRVYYCPLVSMIFGGVILLLHYHHGPKFTQTRKLIVHIYIEAAPLFKCIASVYLTWIVYVWMYICCRFLNRQCSSAISDGVSQVLITGGATGTGAPIRSDVWSSTDAGSTCKTHTIAY